MTRLTPTPEETQHLRETLEITLSDLQLEIAEATSRRDRDDLTFRKAVLLRVFEAVTTSIPKAADGSRYGA